MLFFILLSLLSCQPACAHVPFDASTITLWWGLPFVGILLSLALFPLFCPKIWHYHNGKISLFWALATLLPLTAKFGFSTTIQSLAHTYLLEYIPFILLITSLYTITGGIRLDLKFQTTPLINTLILIMGSLCASLIGTTGAAMLFIRPMLALNQWRKNKTHLMIFFIFSICNIGGCLTAVGDPPLLLGYLKGIDFFWTTQHLFIPFLIIMIPLMTLFFMMDWYYYHKDLENTDPPIQKSKTLVRGKINFFLLGLVIGVILLTGTFRSGKGLSIMGLFWPLESIIREVCLIVLTLLSLLLSSRETRLFNVFTWDPILEVAKLFAAIFVTVIPVLAILGLGTAGALSSIVNLVTSNGEPVNIAYFWLSGLLSSFLDNAPTYLVFFHLAGADPVLLMTTQAKTLAAISAGSVFMGALTYIGNAPNFLVKSMAETKSIRMPSFFGYIGWSLVILGPLFLLTSFFFY